MEQVLVTGASGYIGLHCISQLLEQGYRVRGTVRSAQREGELRDALDKAGVSHEAFSVVEADLMKDDGWDAAVEGCDYVLHVASPFLLGEPKDPEDWIRPAVDGTLRVLRAASRAGVKKTVLTSSCAAITEGGVGKQSFTEDDWTDTELSTVPTYYKSKALAERAAWDFMAGEGKDAGMRLTAINPAAVIGPSLTADIGTSNQVVKRLIDGSMPATIAMHLGYVDVRDVAAAHILAMKNEASDGLRFIVSERELWLHEAASILRDGGYAKAPKIKLPNWLARIIGIFDPEVRATLSTLGQQRVTPADRARKVLGWQPRDARESVLEAAQQIRSLGLAK